MLLDLRSLAETQQPEVPAPFPGALDSPRISEGLYRRKKRKAREPERAVSIPPLEIPQRPSAPNFQALAKRQGKTLAQLSAQVDAELAELFKREQETDDEDALLMILTALD